MRRWLLDRINGVIDTLVGLGVALVALQPISLLAKAVAVAVLLSCLYVLANAKRWAAGIDITSLARRSQQSGPPAQFYEFNPSYWEPTCLVASDGGSLEEPSAAILKDEAGWIGRNDPCWCGSGKKYKKCHGS